MAERKPNLLVPVIGATVLVAGGVGAYFYFNKPVSPPTTGDVKSPAATGTVSVVPKKSLMAVSITTDGAALTQLEKLLSPDSKKFYDSVVAQVTQGLNTSDFSFDRDVKPWLGKNITVAILPAGGKTATLQLERSKLRYAPVSYDGSVQLVQATPPVSATPNFLIVAEVKDKASATKFLETTKTKAGGKAKQSDYKGVQVSQFGEGSKETATAFVGDYLVAAPNEQSVKQAIDTFKGEASLGNAIAADDLKIKNPLANIYIPDFASSIEQLAAFNPNATAIPPETLKELKQITAMQMGLGVDEAGIRLKVLAKLDPASDLKATTSPNKVLSQLPAEAFAVVSGINIKASWERLNKQAEKNPEIKEKFEEFKQQAKASPLSIDLDKDVFGWMDGEFALAAIASKPEGILAQTFGVGPVMIFQTSNRSAAEALLKKFDDYISKNGGSVQKKDVGGVSVTEWSAPGAPGAIIAHGWHQQDAFFFTMGPLTALLVPKPSRPLDANATFQAVTATLEKSGNAGYFYFDLEKAWSLYNSALPASQKDSVPPEAKAAIENIRGLGMTASYPSKEVATVEILLALKPQGK